MSRGYTTPDLVAAELGAAFTPEEEARCAQLIDEAEPAIDRYTRRAWLLPSPITDPITRPAAGALYLRSAPVATVSLVESRSAAIGQPWTALTAGTQYELLDPERGVVTVAPPYPYDVVVEPVRYRGHALFRVTYTTSPTPLPVPLPLQTATTLIVADRMRAGAAAAASVLTSASVGQGDVAVDYRDPPAADPAAASPWPAQAVALLATYRRTVLV